MKEMIGRLGKTLLEQVPSKLRPYADTYVRAQYYKANRFMLYGRKDLPLSVNIETNSLCTRDCYYCPRLKKKSDVLDEAAFYSIINQLKGWGFKGRISLHQYNEPLTDKRIFAFLRYTRKQLAHSRLVLYTNGDLLTSNVLDCILSVGVSQIRVSIHEPSTDEFVERLEKLKKQYHGVLLFDFRDGRRSAPLTNRGGLLELGTFEKVRTCLIETMVIRADGNVVLCCDDVHERCVFGNIKGEQLHEIWNKPEFSKLRQNLRAGILELSMCQKCGFID